jgi:DNA uptake protein ComE-like DNA-binding protein
MPEFISNMFAFSREQRKGILLLFVIIVALQCVYFFVDFSDMQKSSVESKEWVALQKTLDTVKLEKAPPIRYAFNPNYISDFKGYQLGMKSEEIKRLLDYRNQGKFVNSPEEFQKVTGVSEALLKEIAPYFKFPDWVLNKNKSFHIGNEAFKNNKTFPKKEVLKVLDINQATKEEFMKIYGIGDVISDRILTYRNLLGGFVSMDQMNEIWGLSPEVVEKSSHTLKKVNINTASIKELGVFPYFKYPISKNIVSYRSMNGAIKIEDLANIKGFPVDKIKIIALYLEF